MPNINVYYNAYAKIEQLPLQRDWMDTTYERHAYQCFPISLSNRIGWGISFPEDISFVWDGITDSDPNGGHVKVLSGDRYVHTGRANSTISFNTDITFVCEEKQDLSLLTMPVPNQFIRGAQCMTTVISPSVLQGDLPIAWMITEPNLEITIPAGTPVASIIPISLKEIQNYPLLLEPGRPPYQDNKWMERRKERSRVSQELNQSGNWTKWYRNAVDHLGEKSGEHEVKKIVMEVSNRYG